MAGTLEKLALAQVKASGVSWYEANQALRKVVREWTEIRLISEIGMVSNIDAMRPIQGCGLNSRVLRELMARWRVLQDETGRTG